MLTAIADERAAVLLRWVGVLKGLSFKDAGFTLMHAEPVALQLQWQQEPVCNTLAKPPTPAAPVAAPALPTPR